MTLHSRHKAATSWVEVDTMALLANLHAFHRRIGPKVEFVHVVKSNAYGHGLELVAREDEAAGIVHRLAVISVDELLRVRAAGVRLPVMILGYVPPAAWPALVDAEGTPVITSVESAERFNEAAMKRGRELKVHIKIETGTNRYGVEGDELLNLAARIAALPAVRLEGVSTHYANIEDTTDHTYARAQMERFQDACTALERAGSGPLLRHTACSAATLLFPESHMDLVRVGVASYGIWPSKETKVSAGHIEGANLDLRPVLTWKTRVAQVKQVPAGSFVGYGCSWRAPVDSRLAVLPVGYADGYDRQLGNAAHVLIRGQRAPVRGRVCMNVCMADVTHIPDAAVEDEVVLLGKQRDDRVSAEQLAGWCDTIPYEILARIGEHLPRVRTQG